MKTYQPKVGASILGKFMEPHIGVLEMMDNAIAAAESQKILSNSVLIEIIETNGVMTLKFKSIALGPKTKEKAIAMMNMGSEYEVNKNERNENSIGMKGAIYNCNPYDNAWSIKCRNGDNIFKIQPPLMNFSFDETFTEWDEGIYNFVVTAEINYESVKDFYRNLTPDFFAWIYMGIDHRGWRLYKNIEGIVTDEYIPDITISKNEYVTMTTKQTKTYKLPTGGSFSIKSELYEMGTNLPKQMPRNTKNSQTKDKLPALYPKVPLFSVRDIGHCTAREIAGKSNNIAKNPRTRGIYIYVNGRFNSHFDVDLIGPEGHGSYNAAIAFVFISTNNTRFPADGNKTGFKLREPNSDIYVKAIENQTLEWFYECKAHGSEKKKRKVRDIVSADCAEELFDYTGIEYDPEVRIDELNLYIDGAWKINGELITLREFKRGTVDINDANQITAYHRAVLYNKCSYKEKELLENHMYFPNFYVYCNGAAKGVSENAKELFAQYYEEIRVLYPTAGKNFKIVFKDINPLEEALED